MIETIGIGLFCLCAGRGLKKAVFKLLGAEETLAARRHGVTRAARNMSIAVRNAARWSIKLERTRKQLGIEDGVTRDRLDDLTVEVKRLAEIELKPRWIMEVSMRGMKDRWPMIVRANDPGKALDRLNLPAWSIESWTVGRLILVPGTSRDDAYRRAEARWPISAGFEVRDALPSEINPLMAKRANS